MRYSISICRGFFVAITTWTILIHCMGAGCSNQGIYNPIPIYNRQHCSKCCNKELKLSEMIAEQQSDLTARLKFLNESQTINKSFFDTIANHPEELLYERLSFFWNSNTKTHEHILSDTFLFECTCKVTNSHNRILPGNTRTKMEHLIVSHIKKTYLNQKQIRLLSLGAGGCLQDLILVAKLAASGVDSIHITLVEPEFTERGDTTFDIQNHNNAYQEFDCLLKRMQQVYGTNLTLSWNKACKIDAVHEKFDLVYAIDYDDYGIHDYSDRKLDGREKTVGDEAYQAGLDLIKASNLTESIQDALVIMSHGKNIISLTPATASCHFDDMRPYTDFNKSKNKIGAFYINADMNLVLLNLQSLMNHLSSPLLINQSIIGSKDRVHITTFLARHRIDHKYIDDHFAPDHFKEIAAPVWILDYVFFDTKKGEVAVEERYADCNVWVVRCDREQFFAARNTNPADYHQAYPAAGALNQ